MQGCKNIEPGLFYQISLDQLLPVDQGFGPICFTEQEIFIVELPISFFEVTLCDAEHWLPFWFGPNMAIGYFGNKPESGNLRTATYGERHSVPEYGKDGRLHFLRHSG